MTKIIIHGEDAKQQNLPFEEKNNQKQKKWKRLARSTGQSHQEISLKTSLKRKHREEEETDPKGIESKKGRKMVVAVKQPRQGP